VTTARPDPVAGPWSLDEDLLAAARTSGRPQIAAYPHPDVCAVIGSGGDPWVETRPDRLAADGIPLRRRRGGGCAVVVDPGNLICSLALPAPGIGGITGAFGVISTLMGDALAALGVAGVVQEGVSDLAVAGRKLGGSCIWRTRGLLYYSTTLLVDPDWEAIDRYLPHPPREPGYRAGRPHREFLTSLRELGLPAAPADLASRLAARLAAAEPQLGPISG